MGPNPPPLDGKFHLFFFEPFPYLFKSYSGVPLASKIVEQLKQFVNCFGTYFLVMLYVVEAYKSLHNRIIINRKYEINLPSSAKLSMKLCHFFF